MDCVNFSINGKKYQAGRESSATTTLNEFIRRSAGLRGTKYMCLEGGCGTCVVSVRALQPPPSNEISTFSVNSCLMNVLSCDGWDITTVEGIGNRSDGYNVIQTRLNHYFGSQCGYCSPGFVMSMYSLTQKCEGHLTAEEIEKSFGSNLCRCTGYRPILEAFKSLATKPDQKLLMKIKDIEDVGNANCPKTEKECTGRSCNSKLEDWCVINANVDNPYPALPKKISLSDGKMWYSVESIRSIFDVLNKHGTDSYMLIAGNTARGARPLIFYPKILIDINNIGELRNHYLDVNLVLGANMTLTETMELFAELSKTNDEFWYLHNLREHLEHVAHIPVRNVGTLAGNLILKHEHPDFQSDVFILFECVGAILTLVDKSKKKTEISLSEFMKISVIGKVMTEIKLPPLSRHHKLVTYKIAAKEQNAHAQVNSAFLLKFNPSNQHIEKASIVYGGISPTFIHAYETEHYLIDKYIFHNSVLQSCLRCLANEINPSVNPPEPLPEYRRMAAVGLFYKCIIKLCPREILKHIYESGSTIVDRPPVSQSYQEYDTDKKEFPITQPLLKKEGLIQCSGEAVFSDDNPTDCNEVFAAMVLAKVNQGEVEAVDTTDALKVEGVVAVLTSADVPGRNSVVSIDGTFILEDEFFLAGEKVQYFNQPVAIVAAKTQALADSATYLVKIKYKNKSKVKPVLTIKDALKAPSEENRITKYDSVTPTDRGTNIKKVIKGHHYSPQQYHHMMELHTALAKPIDDKLEIWTASQYLDGVQRAVANLLKLPDNKVVVMNRRCGGGFGSKMYRANFATCAAALVSHHLNKPCRIAMHLRDIMRATGKRPDSMSDYEVGVDENGKIQYLSASLYLNYGISSNENEITLGVSGFKNCYDFSRWSLEPYSAKTDIPANCFMRGPGYFQGISIIEHIMDHISSEMNLDPIRVRIANYRNENNSLIEILPSFLQKSEYDERQIKIKTFNEHNRWKKRAISFVNMAFEFSYVGNYLALVSVYRGDGTVTINTGGIEMGQGIYTRLCQVAANELRIPVEKVAVIFASTYASPNNFVSGGSITTECSAYAVIRSCQQINERLAPVRAAMPKATWAEIVEEANRRGILLQANYLTAADDPRLRTYSAFGFAAVEIELDVLTGKHWIVRADVFEDAGISINPALDVGQVEGAFVQALSGWTVEHLVYDEEDGELLTDRTWNYHIVGAKDIPHDFRVYLRRKAPNPVGILGSKAVGEPPITMGCVIVQALRSAVKESKLDSGYPANMFVELDVPVTNESALLAAEPRLEEYVLY